MKTPEQPEQIYTGIAFPLREIFLAAQSNKELLRDFLVFMRLNLSRGVHAYEIDEDGGLIKNGVGMRFAPMLSIEERVMTALQKIGVHTEGVISTSVNDKTIGTRESVHDVSATLVDLPPAQSTNAATGDSLSTVNTFLETHAEEIGKAIVRYFGPSTSRQVSVQDKNTTLVTTINVTPTRKGTLEMRNRLVKLSYRTDKGIDVQKTWEPEMAANIFGDEIDESLRGIQFKWTPREGMFIVGPLPLTRYEADLKKVEVRWEEKTA